MQLMQFYKLDKKLGSYNFLHVIYIVCDYYISYKLLIIFQLVTTSLIID